MKGEFCKRGHERTRENTGYGGYCKQCHNHTGRAWRKAHPESWKAGARLPAAVLVQSRARARQRGLEFTLSPQEFLTLRALPCHYCGGKLPEVGGGLDRIDNTIGYVNGNVLPCCTLCNLHRGADWTVEEAEAAVHAVLQLRASQKR